MQGYEIHQSSVAYPLVFLLVSSADHISAATGLSPTVVISKAGGAFATPAGTVAEIGNGWYQVEGNATDAGTLGPLALHATASGADPTDMLFAVVACNPQDGVHYGLSALPNTACTNNASLLTSGTGTDQLSVAAGKALLQATQTGVTIPNVTSVASVTGNVGGSVASVAGNVAGSVASVTGNIGGSVASVAGNVGGSVIGSVGSVTAGVALVAAGLDAVTTETGVNAAQALALILDMVAAKLSGLPGGPAVIRDVNDTANRVVITFDANNNRTAVTLNPPAV